MKKPLKESHDATRSLIKQYAELYRDCELAKVDKSQLDIWLKNHADKIDPQVRSSIENKIKSAIHSKNEATTTSAVGGVMTPFAFSKRGTGNTRAAKQVGYSLAKPVARSSDLSLESQMYSEPAYISPAQTTDPVDSWKDENGLVQHGDPTLDPGLAGFKQGLLPVREVEDDFKRLSKIVEGLNGIKYRLREADVPPAPAAPAAPAQQVPPQAAPAQQATPKQDPAVQVQTYNLQPDFTDFDTQLKNSTEELKLKLQKEIQDHILNKKIVVRASKGFKQPETDYTINVTGVNIDYYYDRYVIIIVGREESKQKTAKFFVKPGYKIRILGPADVKPKDQYQIAKSKALVDPEKQNANNTGKNVTGDEPVPQSAKTAPPKEPTTQQASPQPAPTA